MADPTMEDIRREALQGYSQAVAMLRFLVGERDKDGAAIAWLAVHQLGELIAWTSEPGASRPALEVSSHDPDTIVFFEAIKAQASDYSRNPDPPVVTLERLARHWKNHFKDTPIPAVTFHGEGGETVTPGGVIDLTRPRKGRTLVRKPEKKKLRRGAK